MLSSLLACVYPEPSGPSVTGGHDSIANTDDSATGSTDDSGSGSGSGTDDSATDDSATDDSCTDGSGDDTGPKPWLVPDFALVDMNTSSPTYGHTISPRDYKKRISGWYFIHAD